jgi:galactokinase
MNKQERQAWMAGEFAARFGAAPTLWTRAPGRVDLMGSHTDYNDGYILTMTIDRDTWLSARPRSDGKVCVYSLDAEGGGEFALSSIVRDEAIPWVNYVRGVAQALQEAGYALVGFDGLLHTTVPVASGLSSSAALEMAVGRMFEAAGGLQIDPVTLALLGQRAENHFVGVNCGILDQYTSAMGREGCALLLDARAVTSEDVPIAAGIHVVICDTRAHRALASSQYGVRRVQCEEGALIMGALDPQIKALRDVSVAQFNSYAADLDPVVARRCRFIVEENERVLSLAAALKAGQRPEARERIGALCAASFRGARDLYEIVVPEMEAMLEAMLSGPGAVGARQAGAGFGGCMVAFVEQDAVEAFAAHVRERYQSATGVEPRVYPVRAAPGAGKITV